MRDYAALNRNLLDDLKIEESMLTSDMDPSTASRLWLKNSFWKKFQDVISEGADAKALDLFKQSNRLCQSFRLEPKTTYEDMVIGEVKTIFDDFVHCGPNRRYDSSDIMEGLGVGPGASLGAESYNFYTKLFDSPLTGTSDHLYREYRYAISAHPTWLSAEVARLSKHGCRVVVGNRLSFVPKTSDISRTICTEPVLNMLFQKAIGSTIETELKRRFKIDLSQQPDLNRSLARTGSIGDSYATMDLSSASDSISLHLLKEILPPVFYRELCLARSPTVTYPDDSQEELYMVSSMGNGFTFPLETMLFSSIVVSCYRILGIKLRYNSISRTGKWSPGNFGVFGDDIIVRKDAYAFVSRCLEMFGFQLNDGKSFSAGYFRESCGGDFYRGFNIRGVYCKTLKTSADVYSIINRLVRWSARTGVMLPSTIKLLVGWVKFLPVPYHEDDAAGIKTPYPPAGSAREKSTGGVVYYALTKTPSYFTVPDSDPLKKGKEVAKDFCRIVRYYRTKRNVLYNADGLMLALVGGYIRNGRIGIRSDIDRFKVRRRVAPYWRPISAAGSDTREDDWIVIFELYFN